MPTAHAEPPATAASQMIHRIEVRPRRGHHDPRGQAVERAIAAMGLERRPRKVEHTAVYLIEGELTSAEVDRVAFELLSDCVTQTADIQGGTRATKPSIPAGAAIVETHPLPGVTDPAAESVEAAILSLTGRAVRVRTGDRYDLHGVDKVIAKTVGERLLANAVIHAIHTEPYFPTAFPAGRPYTLSIREVAVTRLTDA